MARPERDMANSLVHRELAPDDADDTKTGRVSAHLATVLTGRAVPYTRPGSRSAIDKRPVDGPVKVTKLGLDGDEQGDRVAHGGPDKAVLMYAFEHYAIWREELGPRLILDAPGAFGENLSAVGLTERNACLGDLLRIGGALLEISQPRQPCWKLADRFGVPDMALRVAAKRRTGWYLRILEEGLIASGDGVSLTSRPFPAWPIRRLIELLEPHPVDRNELNAALALPLVPGWRKPVEARLQRGLAGKSGK
ncbi:MAG: MOSC domain-containing protein [Opitutaceae bacterium]